MLPYDHLSIIPHTCVCPIWGCCWHFQSAAHTFPHMSFHPNKFKSTTISWHEKFHVQVCVTIQIWGEVIVGLRHTGIIGYVFKLLLEFLVVLLMLLTVLWVRFWSIMCGVILFPVALANLNIKLIDAGSFLICSIPIFQSILDILAVLISGALWVGMSFLAAQIETHLNWGAFIAINHIFTLVINLCDRMIMSYRDWSSVSLSYLTKK